MKWYDVGGANVRVFLFFSPFILTLLVGCSEIGEPEQDPGDRLYFNSFESPEDTIGWRGYGAMQTELTAPPGGGIGLRRTREMTGGVFITVSDSSWTFYQSLDTLFCPKGDTLRVEISAGGIVFSAMLVDQLEVRRVKARS